MHTDNSAHVYTCCWHFCHVFAYCICVSAGNHQYLIPFLVQVIIAAWVLTVALNVQLGFTATAQLRQNVIQDTTAILEHRSALIARQVSIFLANCTMCHQIGYCEHKHLTIECSLSLRYSVKCFLVNMLKDNRK